jgi:hypothetical protein
VRIVLAKVKTSRSPEPHATVKLDPEIVADDSKLAAAVDELVHCEPELRRMGRRIGQLQERLRMVIADDAGWAAYLDVEQACNARLAQTALVVGRWAFAEGRRSVEAERGDR